MFTSRMGLFSLALILGAATMAPAAEPAMGGSSDLPLQGAFLPPSGNSHPAPAEPAMGGPQPSAIGHQLSPRLSALHQLGLQNITSISSHPAMGGPQGISVNELPAAAAYRESQRVDSFYAVRAGSTAPIPQIELAHPSHIPGVPGSRPFVSNGPLSPRPGTRRLEPNVAPSASYPYLTSTPSAISHQPTQELSPKASPILSTTTDVARFLASVAAGN